jgi:diguanylate cyclase (GGDEF)-like protein
VLCAAAVTAALPGTPVSQAAYLGCFTTLTVLVWRSARRGGPLSWLLVAAAMTSWLAGDLLSYALELSGREYAVGPCDVLWLGGYPLLGAALLVMVRHRAPGQSRAGALDGLVLATAATLWLWQLVVAPAVAGVAVSLEVVVGVLYPLGDVVLFAAVLYLVLSPGRRGPATRLLVAGMTLTLCCDLAISLLNTYWGGVGVDRTDSLLLLANAMIVGAVRHPGRDELLTPVRGVVETLHPARVLFLGLSLGTAPLIAICRAGLATGERLLLGIGSGVTVALALARFVGAVRQQARVQRLLAQLAAHDELTGLANRRTLIEALERDFRPEPDTVLLYLDLDGFKAVNDGYGHCAGDAVLVEVARRLCHAVRAVDLVARLGGDEFAVLCHRLPPEEAHALAARLAAAVVEPIRHGTLALRVSASIGLAAAAGCPTGDDLIATADRAMYAVKHGERGRFAAVTADA